MSPEPFKLPETVDEERKTAGVGEKLTPSTNICCTMGRGKELSDFQRGTVVGCHMCKKSTREISALLNLPQSTVSNVILRWKRGGITTALPRCGRPHKLKEQDRQVLEKIALESCLPSVEALTTELQTASGAKVSSKTVRRELHEMGFRGRVSTYNKSVAPTLKLSRQAGADEGDGYDDVTYLKNLASGVKDQQDRCGEVDDKEEEKEDVEEKAAAAEDEEEKAADSMTGHELEGSA
uniref:uncharacterized protein LOC124073656 isoform X1 n=1 Tax=Scatophagus argus TaxID=75038 RepID=UPI001ED82ADD|nr:uncharacterized protein LOC124073656 isoform X1 [Scatophagus argus]XP_046272004.1 uncharacterized protein LOC124073656 isoform X1 [Scatophagus argus]